MRIFILTLSLLSLVIPAYALTNSHTLRFSALRDGSPFGRHEVVVQKDGARFIVNININLRVGLGPLTLFRYDHQNREVWESGKLLSLETRTDDNGEKHWVKGQAIADGFRVESAHGQFVAPANIMTTSYWQENTVAQQQLIDTQTGQLLKVASTKAGYDSLDIDGKMIRATRYRVSGDLGLTLWYDEHGRWVKLAFPARGSEIEYQLLSDTPTLP
jgi:hypothetical protein